MSRKEYPKKEKCHTCGREYEAVNDESACPICYNGCCDPGYHTDGYCDGSC